MLNDQGHGDDDLIAIMRSVFVCLNILLDNDAVASKVAARVAELSTDYYPLINSPDAIVANIQKILTDDSFAIFRVHVIRVLPPLFNARLALVHDLDEARLRNIPRIIKDISDCEPGFMKRFTTLLNSQDDITKHACQNVINFINRPVLQQNSANLQNCEYNTYVPPHHGHHHHHHHRNPILFAFHKLKHFFEHLIYGDHDHDHHHQHPQPPIHEHVHQGIIQSSVRVVGGLLWSFRQTVASTIENIGTRLTHHPEHNEEVEENVQAEQPRNGMLYRFRCGR